MCFLLTLFSFHLVQKQKLFRALAFQTFIRTVEPRFSVILAAIFPLNSNFFSGYQKLILLSKITLNRGLPRFSVAF